MPMTGDFDRALIELVTSDAPETLVEQTAALLAKWTEAREVFVELTTSLDADEPTRFWAAEGCDPVRVDAIRVAISRGIIAEALATGKAVVTASAMADPRFEERGSVREHGIEVVLCVPVGRTEPLGVLYLQGRRGHEAPVPFAPEVVARVERLARAIAPTAELMLRRDPQEADLAAHAVPGVVARSGVMREVLARLRLVAPIDVHVLLTGPSGTGKTLLANALHALSERRAQPFVNVNCAALPEALLENELFGAEPGAHSAVPRQGVRGKVEAAEGGTLFLDEVAELTLASQAKLLQLLQERTYYPLGGSTKRRADVRIVAATNADLEAALAERRFREDLYYRLRVFEVRVPSLAERAIDVAPLARHFCRAAAQRHGLAVQRLSPGAIRAIQTAEWPGNARELENRMESAVLHAHLRRAAVVEVRDVFPEAADGANDGPIETLQEATRRFQARHVLGALESTDWNVAEAARRLDVARSHLYTLIRTHDLKRR
ncbi:MAG: sigma-54-dependent Fis family transcriptional regulator [Sandaracinaceae bacterium]|nr:sigma-54-dependent Fis family transcriptional regulator [Sandaracinaceae bacterium]